MMVPISQVRSQKFKKVEEPEAVTRDTWDLDTNTGRAQGLLCLLLLSKRLMCNEPDGVPPRTLLQGLPTTHPPPTHTH